MDAFEAIRSAVEEGILSEVDLDRKVVRIIRLKEDFGLEDKAASEDFKDDLENRIDGLFD
jgi:beta-glucosidase-like glycosyl hydrolase